MIQRYQTSTLAKLGSLLGMALLNLFGLGFILLALSESNILGVLFFGALFVSVAYFPYTLFVRGRIYEAYLLSDRTVAVVHPRRKTRFLKPEDFVEFRPDS
ncbi:MAG: hypothetical protein L3K26_12835, partial [Candidatus Hydrogenedentes bacterium]|nr:hypothetical protein [Candidatus Hydrogenedentota bacterium]